MSNLIEFAVFKRNGKVELDTTFQQPLSACFVKKQETLRYAHIITTSRKLSLSRGHVPLKPQNMWTQWLRSEEMFSQFNLIWCFLVDENHEEYMSLEPPYCEQPYNEPIYDSCSEEYHIPNCEI